MKITKKNKNLIKKEIERILSEQSPSAGVPVPGPGSPGVPAAEKPKKKFKVQVKSARRRPIYRKTRYEKFLLKYLKPIPVIGKKLYIILNMGDIGLKAGAAYDKGGRPALKKYIISSKILEDFFLPPFVKRVP